MEKQNMSLVFIDRLNYDNLQSSKFSIEDVSNIIYEDLASVSLLTRACVINLNKELNKLLYYSYLTDSYYGSIVLLNNQEKQFINDNFISTQLKNIYPIIDHDKKYYEIILLPDNKLLVIVEEGFLTLMTEIKDNLLEFILDCLRYQNKFNLNSLLLKSYIGLKLNDTQFNIIKSRFEPSR